MSVEQEMISRLTEVLRPESLEIRNDSAKHAGHAGDDGSGESHFSITIKAAALDGKSRVAQHRAIYDALEKDLVGRIHALAINVLK